METRMSVEHGYAGIKEGFKITGPSGETAIGYAYGADFPMDVSSPSRGELFLVNVPEHRRRRGAGKAISIRAIEMMKQQHGCETVVMHATSAGGRAIIESLIAEGYISEPIRTSETGKKEYRILSRVSVESNPPAKWGIHSTYRKKLPSILKHGLQPKVAHMFPEHGPVIYFCEIGDGECMGAYAEGTAPDDWVLLRFRWPKQYRDLGGEFITRKAIPPSQLQVFTQSAGWLDDYSAGNRWFLMEDDKYWTPLNVVSNPEEISDGLEKWFSGSQIVDKHGKPLLVYHGSRERGLTKISKMRTCYGLFFSPDMDTAGYYAGDDCCIYKAYLKIENLADFDDDMVFNAVADAAFGGYEGERYVSIKRQRSGDEEEAEMTGGEFRSWLQKAMQALHKDSAAIQRFLQKAVSGSNEAYPSDPPITLKDLNDADIFESVFESLDDPGNSDISALMKEEPRLQEDFDSEYYTFDKGVDDARKAYGSQDFYMYHQDDMLKAAEHLGYDGVVLTDPSSRGESISYVAFSPDQIRIVGTVEEYEVKG